MCGLTITEFNRITPAELSVMADAKVKYRNADQTFFDGLNGVACSTLALINGAKNAKPADFMITTREPENNTEDDPMKRVERIKQTFETWAVMTGGK